MTKNKKSMRVIIAFALFLGALYLAELSPFSSRAIALINGGYGTFDMKKYDVATFVQVMKDTQDFTIYWKYYICDFLFIAAFLNMMFQVVAGLSFRYDKLAKMISYILAGARAMLDAVENILLMYLIYDYPNADTGLVNISNTLTQVKFMVMRGWILCFLVFLVLHFIHKRNNIRNRAITR